MTEPENYEEDLFADLYENDEASASAAPIPAANPSLLKSQTDAQLQETPGLDLNPGGHDEENEPLGEAESFQIPPTNGTANEEHNEQMQDVNYMERDQQEHLFGTGIKEDG